MKKFAFNYVKSMRLHFGFLTILTGWIGVSFFKMNTGAETSFFKESFILAVLFLSYGINQVINDFFGREEDKINAPHRPMVTGDLNPHYALAVSFGLMASVAVISYFLNPFALLAVLLGVVLNLIYEYAKAWSLLGNLFFGLSITTCALFGFFAMGTTEFVRWTPEVIWGLIYLVLVNGVMTYFTYFKDYEGDKKADKKTFIVTYGPHVGKICGVVISFFSPLLFLIAFGSQMTYSSTILFLFIVSTFLQLQTGIAYFLNPIGEKTYYNLKTNIRAGSASMILLLSVLDGMLALYLLIISYILIGIIFDFHSDAKG